MFKLILFVLPLGLDAFAVAAALGMRRLPSRQRLRVSLVMSSFEMAMPVVGLVFSQIGMRVGARLNETLRERAGQLAGLALLGLAVLLAGEKLI